MNNKVEKVVQLFEDNGIKIGVVGETWLSSANNHVTGYLRERGYNIHHHHRDSQRGGGVSVIFENTIRKEQSKIYNYRSFECLSVSFMGVHDKKLIFVALYCCGDEPMSLFLKEFRDLIESLHFSHKDFIVCGDFNIHCNDGLNSDVTRFYEILNAFSLKQFVNEPTHIKGNTIDLVICNPEKVSISDVNVCADTSSDHSIIYFNINYQTSLNEPQVVAFRNVHDINENAFKQDLETELAEFHTQSLNSPSDFKSSVTSFNKIQQDILDKHAPVKKKIKFNNNKPKWMDREFKEARADRRKKYKKWRRTRDDCDRNIFVTARKFVADMVLAKKKNYYSSLISNCNNSQRELFKVCNNLLDKPKCSVLPKSTSPNHLANRFNDFFCDKIEKIRSKFPPSTQNVSEGLCVMEFPVQNSTLNEFEPVTEEQLVKIIKSAPIKTSPDDPIPAILLKTCIDSILPNLVQLVNLSLTTGSMDGLKESVVTPLLKKLGADTEELSNYRPITGIKYLGKLIERTVLPQLMKHMHYNTLHIPNQSGYKPGYSCETLLARLINDILLNMDMGMCTVLLLLDLSAAFDTVDHAILVDILFREIGLRGTVLEWFTSFLKGRRQAITINGTKSSYRDNAFGVPQGSVLGPVLFNIYVRSLIAYLEKHGFSVHGYADDHQIFKSFKIEFQFVNIRSSLPKVLDLVSSWMQMFFLKLNASKSQVIVFSPNSGKILVQRVFLSDGSIIPLSNQAMNLGALLDCHLTFGPQIDLVICNCYRLLRDISSIRKYITEDEIKDLVNSLVVARIDNNNVLYSGLPVYQISKLQKLQNSCARVIYGVRRREHVSPLLKQLHWLPIRLRIIFKVLCLIFKCLHNTAPSYLIDILPETHENRFVRIPRTCTSIGDRAFSRFGPIYWNALPFALRSCQSIQNFKAKLKHYLFSSSPDYFQSLNRYRNWT